MSRTSPGELERLQRAGDCLALLRERSATLATAESLTAGLVCATLAGVSGASDVLRGGLAAYSTDVKTSILGVDPALVAEHGVVSIECAYAMATGARTLLAADWGVSATGVAGPDRQEGKPVGTVFVAVAGPGVVHARELRLSGSRAEIRFATVDEALDLLRCIVGGGHG